jgi:hypothetical protein
LEDKNNNEKMRKVLKMFISKEIVDKEEVTLLLSGIMGGFMDADRYVSCLRNSVDDHNFRVVGMFFSVIKLEDLSVVMQCSMEECVDKICFMVNSGAVRCKIDQGKGILSFCREEEGVEEYRKSIENVLDKVMKANHLIHKENLKFLARGERED